LLFCHLFCFSLVLEHLSKTELRAVLAAARAHRERNWLMLLVAYSHGLRATEVVRLQRDAVSSEHIVVARLKGSLRTVQPLVSDADPLLDERAGLFAFLASVHGKQRLFPITRQHFWRLFQRYAAAAGLPKHKRHPHVLKHTIAMQTIHSAGIENVRQYLGHKSMASTGAYLKVNDEQASDAIAEALRGSPAL
jgi:site-specific recombinase XerD